MAILECSIASAAQINSDTISAFSPLLTYLCFFITVLSLGCNTSYTFL